MLQSSYALHAGVFAPAEMRSLAAHLAPVQRAGTRSLLDDPAVREVAADVRLRRMVSPGLFAVRALLLDKTAGTNWGLRWHQDLSIAVRERREVAGIGRGR